MGIDLDNEQIVRRDENGVTYLTWRIYDDNTQFMHGGKATIFDDGTWSVSYTDEHENIIPLKVYLAIADVMREHGHGS
jgi:hypothetical protein